MDILLRRRLSPAGQPDGWWRADLVDTMTCAIVAADPSAAVDYFGIRFRPGEAFRFLRFPVSETRNLLTNLDDVLRPLARELVSGFESARDTSAQIEVVDRALLARTSNLVAPDFRVRQSIETLRIAPNSVASMAEVTGLSPRQLQRLFDERVGVGPKWLARIFRLQRGVERLTATPRVASSAVAATCGYADQAHFVREFRALAGITPRAFLRAREVSDSFNTGHVRVAI